MNLYVKLVLLASFILLIGIVGYGSYEFVTFKNLKNACISKISEGQNVLAVYFDNGTDESLLAKLATQLQQTINVASVAIISSDEALKDFRQRHADDALILQSLEELGTNPL